MLFALQADSTSRSVLLQRCHIGAKEYITIFGVLTKSSPTAFLALSGVGKYPDHHR